MLHRPSQMGTDRFTTFMPILLACLSYIFTTFHTLRSEQHRNLVERVSNQLKALYGPLLACVTASKSSYEAMISQFNACPGKARCTPAAFRTAVRSNPNSEEAVAYRMWVKNVLMPLSVKAADIIIARADLLEGTSIEPLLLQLVAHVSACALYPALPRAGLAPAHHSMASCTSQTAPAQPSVRRYKVILRQWEQGAVGEFSTMPYPEEIHQWASREFGRLKRRQAMLLGLSGSMRGGLMRAFASKL